MHVFIATPMYGGQCTGFYMQSMMELQRKFMEHGITCTVSLIFNESLITRARNALVHGFMKMESDYLLFIDADIKFRSDDVINMIKSDVDIICGIYPKKEINWYTVKAAIENGVPVDQLKYHTGSFVVNLVDYKGEVTIPIDKPAEIWNGGTGFMLIKRGVFDKLSEKVPAYTNDVVDTEGHIGAEDIKEFFTTSIEPGTNRLLSEDYHFCRLWRDNGGKVHAAPWTELSHIGTYCFDGKLLKSS